MPELYIITGSNGAGKSTIGPMFLPQGHLQNSVFDGDLAFVKKRSEFYQSGIRSHKECKKMAYEWLTNHFDSLVVNAMETQSDFAYEGHFTNDATWDVPKKFKANGYHIHLIYFGLSNTEISEYRVVARSKEGGHYVAPQTVSDNFYGNLEKLDKYYSIFDSVQIYDTTEIEYSILAVLENGIPVFAFQSNQLPDWFISNMPEITNKIIGMGKRFST